MKKIRVAGRDLVRLHRLPHPELLLHVARQRDAVLREDVLREAAAVEAVADPSPPFRYGLPRSASAVPVSA